MEELERKEKELQILLQAKNMEKVIKVMVAEGEMITMQEGAVDAQVRSATAGFSIDSTSSFKQAYGRIHKRRGTRGRRFGTGLGRSHSQLVIAQDVSESFRRALRKGREERDAKKKQGVLSPTKIEEKKQIMSKLAGG